MIFFQHKQRDRERDWSEVTADMFHYIVTKQLISKIEIKFLILDRSEEHTSELQSQR